MRAGKPEERTNLTGTRNPALVPCAVLLLLPLLHTPSSASAVLLLILMLPLLRVQHHQPVVRVPTFFLSEDTTGCAACFDLTGIADLRYIRSTSTVWVSPMLIVCW